MIFQLPNPIPETVKDTEQLTEFYRKYGIIPYFGTNESSSQGMLDLLMTLSELSPSFNAVRRDLKEYTFGQNARIQAKQIEGLELDIAELDANSQIKYFEYLKDIGIQLKDILKKLRTVDDHLSVSGNAYIRIKRVTVVDTVRYFISVPHFKHVAYLNSRDAGEQFVIISKWIGDEQMMIKYKPTIIRVTQQGMPLKFDKKKGGVEEAIVHIKSESNTDESDYYGRPDIIPVLHWLYTDYQVGNLNSKISATEIITKKILAFEGEDPNAITDDDDYNTEFNGKEVGGSKLDSFQRNMLTLKKLTTQLGSHPSEMGPNAVGSIAGVEYPHGGSPPTVIDLEMNRDTGHQTFQQEQATTMIAGNQGWAPELVSLRKTATTLGGNLLYDIFSIKNTTTIRPRQIKFEDIINNILHQIVTMEGNKEFEYYGIELIDNISKLVESMKSTSTTTASEMITEPQNTVGDEGIDGTE